MAQGSVKQASQRGRSPLIALSNHRGPLLQGQERRAEQQRQEHTAAHRTGPAIRRPGSRRHPGKALCGPASATVRPAGGLPSVRLIGPPFKPALYPASLHRAGARTTPPRQRAICAASVPSTSATTP